ncbi:MAG: hypothetical protein M1818_002124 [Claussenomyces sp. TS43310]|nr:MAG: hypothetical protein M1818_002124 [Claussenomyces sp. TS43310]
MVYDWDNKEEICYTMYIEEKKSLEEIMEYMKIHHKFEPRWEFPSKQNPAHKNHELVQRVKELWERNTSQKEMLRVLNEEDGFDIKERELMRVRAKNRWLLRVPNGMKSTNNKRETDQDVMDQLQQALFEDEVAQEDGESLKNVKPDEGAVSPELSPEVLAKRQERLEKLQAESAERWASRKRRRRTRGWAGLPADPPGPPRFPSETTIDESKAFLSLDSNLYRDIRARFQRICEETDIIKKTIAGPERWDAVKSRLVQESSHLQSVFWDNEENQEQKKLSLDVICTDVTKRMRTLERRMTIAEAKNALGINPEESRTIRNAFYQTLKADHFTSKLEAGDEHWKELKAQWIEGSDLLKGILAPGDADPRHQEKVRAMEVLCRDVMKRLRDDQTKRDPTRKKKFDSNYVANPAPPHVMGQYASPQEAIPSGYMESQPQQDMNGPGANQYQDAHRPHDLGFEIGPHDALVQAAAHAQAQAQAQAQSRVQSHSDPLSGHDDMQIDPSLLLAANDPSLIGHAHFPPQQQYPEQQYATHVTQAAYPAAQTSIAVYFRLHPMSDIQTSNRLWVSTLTSISVDELRQLAAAKFPTTYLIRVEGIIKEPNGNEMGLQIDQDEELAAYLANSVKPTFAVQLMQGWKSD